MTVVILNIGRKLLIIKEIEKNLLYHKRVKVYNSCQMGKAIYSFT